MNQVAAKLRGVQAAIADAARKAGRDPGEVLLVAVSKAQPEALAREALEAGHRVFGENRVQEAEAKWPKLRMEFPGIELHMIGPLQTNKVREAVRTFDVIETVDRLKLAAALAREMAHAARRTACYVQVNTGEEPQKAGVLPGEADAFIEACRQVHNLPVTGLMCIPPLDEEPSLHFALLREIARRNGIENLSMGMSADYTVAVAFGATHVRVGTAIFGYRSR